MSRWNIHEGTPADQGRLTARPVTKGDKLETPSSIQTLSVGTTRFGLISVPPGYSPDRLAPLLVLLHGAGGEAKQAIGWLQTIADETGLILLAQSWLRKSEHRDKWSFCLKAASMRAAQEKQ
jgi:poly(3-hydroxybutyrate) depolymerase